MPRGRGGECPTSVAISSDVTCPSKMEAQSDIVAAAKAGDAAAVARLLEADRRLVRSRDRWRNTPLHHAGSAEVAGLLIGHGADVNADGWMGAAPLHHAAEHGRADVVER